MKITKQQLKQIIKEEFAGLTGAKFNTDPKKWPTPESPEEAEDLSKWQVGGIVNAELEARSTVDKVAGRFKGLKKGNWPRVGLSSQEIRRLEKRIYDELVAMAEADIETGNVKAGADYERGQTAKKAVQDVDTEYEIRRARKQSEYKKDLDKKAAASDKQRIKDQRRKAAQRRGYRPEDPGYTWEPKG